VNLRSCGVTTLPSHSALTVHVVLMSVAWGIVLPCSVIIARLYRGKKGRSGRDKKPWWLVKHEAYGILGGVMTTVGFCTGVYMNAGSGTVLSTVHGKIGVVVMVGTLWQCGVGLCVSRKRGECGTLWLVHRVLGYITVVAAVAAMTLGIRRFPSPYSTVASLVFLGGFLCVLAAFVLKSLSLAARAVWSPVDVDSPASKVVSPPKRNLQSIASPVKTGTHQVPSRPPRTLNADSSHSSYSDSNPLPAQHRQAEISWPSPQSKPKSVRKQKHRGRSSSSATDRQLVPQQLTAGSNVTTATDEKNPELRVCEFRHR
jgi:Eukaryotic cytochrome b561